MANQSTRKPSAIFTTAPSSTMSRQSSTHWRTEVILKISSCAGLPRSAAVPRVRQSHLQAQNTQHISQDFCPSLHFHCGTYVDDPSAETAKCFGDGLKANALTMHFIRNIKPASKLILEALARGEDPS